MHASAKIWIFDLDNTLHNATPHIFPHINQAMTAYMQAHLNIDEAKASELQQHYWRRYGATLVGLMRHHSIRPKHFLWHTHQFPALNGMVLVERGLRAALNRLSGRKLLFTNGPQHYAQTIMRKLKIVDLFDSIFAIEHTRHRPKPDVRGFFSLLKKNRLYATQCIMVEDTLENLKAAKRLGMKTVWISDSKNKPAFVDRKIRSILALPGIQHQLH